MKRRLSILLVMSLVLIGIMSVCFMGCTKAPAAFKGVNMKNVDEVTERIDDIIEEGNYTSTVEMKANIDIPDTPTYAIDQKFVYKISNGLMEVATSSKSEDSEGKFIFEDTKTGGNIYTYNEDSGSWSRDEYDKETYKEERYIADMYNFVTQIDSYDLEYDKKNNIYEGEIKFFNGGLKVLVDATMEITEDSIIMKMSYEMPMAPGQSSNTELVVTIEDMGGTSVKIPKINA